MRAQHIAFAQARAHQAAALRGAIGRLSDELPDRHRAGWFQGAGPVLVAIGASFAAACAPVWSLRSRGVHAWRLGAGDHPLPLPVTDHPVVAVSQSGRSPETLAVLESVRPDLRYAVTNASPSPIEAATARHLSVGGIPDSYASTIGYTATVVALGMMADLWGGGRLDPAWRHLPEHVARVEHEVAARAAALAAPFATARAVDVVGAGPSVGSAEAGALLFREVARLPATAMSTRQYLHGAMESAGGGVHVVFGDHREVELGHTLSRAGHQVLLVTSGEVEPAPALRVVRLPALPPAPRAVLEAVVLQLLAERAATDAGIEIEEFVFHPDDTKLGDGDVVGSAQ